MSVADKVIQFIQQQRLPENYRETALSCFVPLAQRLVDQARNQELPLLVGIHGCQGSGKSTLTELLLFLFEHHFDVAAVGMSIDDFYLTRLERVELSSSVHPLLITRGVPGTHDTAFLADTLTALSQFNGPVSVPRFNKAQDDRYPSTHWTQVGSAPEIILLEGWCVGSGPQRLQDLVTPVNALEEFEDQDRVWRTYVNERLAVDYQPIFQRLDRLVMLKAPGFFAVQNWRMEQETKLRQKVEREQGDLSGVMDAEQISRFIQHYQRITEHSLADLPNRASDVFSLNAQRQIESATLGES